MIFSSALQHQQQQQQASHHGNMRDVSTAEDHKLVFNFPFQHKYMAISREERSGGELSLPSIGQRYINLNPGHYLFSSRPKREMEQEANEQSQINNDSTLRQHFISSATPSGSR